MRKALDPARLRGVYDRVSRRYDLQHAFATGWSDWRGRRMVVERAVRPGDGVLDCGAGTGSTSLLAAERVGPDGRVTLLDQSEGMLAVAREKLAAAGFGDRVDYRVGDMLALPFDDGQFDVVLSTYSLCPLTDPALGAAELYRVVKPGGRIGVAHSADPPGRFTKWLADVVESVVWRLPALSLGCRAVETVPALERAGARTVLFRRIGLPLWPFVVYVMEKPAA